MIHDLRQNPIIESLGVQPGELDRAALVASLWRAKSMEREGFDFLNAIGQTAQELIQNDLVLEGVEDGDLAWFQALIEKIEQFDSDPEAVFKHYFRGVMEGKAVAKTYRQLLTSCLESHNVLKMLFSLGTHLAIESESHPFADRFMRVVNRHIDSILENGDHSMAEAVRYAGQFLSEK